ncbi:hypothetical protein [Acinetobacter sp. YH01009]|uniref:hypothetical protein n=1 Tax=Acinetobacter sp. YH01009 TaxID=2601025 RepID=UPI0015D34E97|nr:hypothetical protein [Acinetobacter sp. YH01009]
MDKAKFTANVLLLSKIKDSMSETMGNNLSVLEVSYILNQSMNPLMSETYAEQVAALNKFELDPIEVLKKRKNLKILKILNLILLLNLDSEHNKENIEHYHVYIEKFLENIATIGLDRLDQEALKVQIQNLLKYNWES